MLHITNACNLDCSYCYLPKTSLGIMEVDTAIKAIAGIRRLAGEEPFGIHFFGGEPLLEYDTIRRIVHECAPIFDRCSFHISTNGTLLRRDICDYLGERDFRTIISYDGMGARGQRVYRNGSNAGMAIRRGLALLGQHPATCANTVVRVTVSPEGPNPTAVLREVLKAGISRIHLRDVSLDYPSSDRVVSALVQHYQELAREMLILWERGERMEITGRATGFTTILRDLDCAWPREGGCRCGASKMTVLPDGGLIPCSRYAFSPNRMGSAVGGPDPAARVHYNAQRFPDVCHECYAQPTCGGPCHADVIRFPALAPPNSWHCRMVRERLAMAIWLRHELHERGFLRDVIEWHQEW